ncbi:hypothetical protein ACLEPN_16615 [Myxococcus sp. 1LA]
MRRLLLLSFLPAMVLLVAPGCPLDIRIRCDESTGCPQGQVCVSGGCEPVTPSVDGGCTGAECEIPDGGCTGSGCETPDAGCTGAECETPDAGCTGSGCETPDAGCTGSGCGTPDAGCSSTVPVGSACTQPCECANDAAACVGGMCTLTCSTDFTCHGGRRCEDGNCVVGPRLGESCEDAFDCAEFAQCPRDRMRCEAQCNPSTGFCAPGYQCAPDWLCVRECSGTPASVGQVCDNSLDCAPCSVCVSTGAVLRCRQPCQQDRDCPGGAPGACQQVGDTRACRL